MDHVNCYRLHNDKKKCISECLRIFFCLNNFDIFYNIIFECFTNVWGRSWKSSRKTFQRMRRKLRCCSNFISTIMRNEFVIPYLKVFFSLRKQHSKTFSRNNKLIAKLFSFVGCKHQFQCSQVPHFFLLDRID